ncbi:MAG: hypothetical protein ICV66_04095 [Chitinophagaceae bacterium]|nr:hypothetical protein [Chitinophagaceae bacterium]
MKVFLILSAILLSMFSNAQQCSVLIKALSDKYEGECKGNKAHGKGTAKGEDEYTGDFKNGLPDGFGKYTWKSGDWYEGQWKKGEREGSGTMHYNTTAEDSVQQGFWKNDRYIGRYEAPYIIHSKTSGIISVGVSNSKQSTFDDITFRIQSISGGASTITGQIIPKIIVNDIALIQGNFLNRFDQNNMPKTSLTTLHTVTFPVRAKIYMGSEVMDIEINDPGNWQIDIRIQK